ncbi:MAG: hypothetical protein QOJ76_1634, partial [Acidobacteriota bacterium]|nr:hypothetical protein [Acidobacteriota bacterium]
LTLTRFTSRHCTSAPQLVMPSFQKARPGEVPDDSLAGYNFWLSKLNQFGGDFIKAEMVKAFISSDEYRKRFGQ